MTFDVSGLPIPAADRKTIAASLMTANGKYNFKDGLYRRGMSTIHVLDRETAMSVEQELRRVASQSKLPVNYLAAYVQQESTGDPKAEFRNAVQWEAAKDDIARFASTDHGLVQISGKNLILLYPNEATAQLTAKALDIKFAVDYLARATAENIEWAKQIDFTTVKDIDPDNLPKARNPYWLAALAYNRGRPGALAALINPRASRHADMVISAWSQIDSLVGVDPSETVHAPIFPISVKDDSRRLAMGEISPSVEALQRLLNDRTSPSPNLKVDGNFGPATRDALMKYQSDHSLQVTGITDDQTWASLLGYRQSTSLTADSTPLVMGDVGSRVAALQRRLNEALQLQPPLNPDGNFGPGTRDVLIRFQRSKNISATGAADLQTVDALGSPEPAK